MAGGKRRLFWFFGSAEGGESFLFVLVLVGFRVSDEGNLRLLEDVSRLVRDASSLLTFSMWSPSDGWADPWGRGFGPFDAPSGVEEPPKV